MFGGISNIAFQIKMEHTAHAIFLWPTDSIAPLYITCSFWRVVEWRQLVSAVLLFCVHSILPYGFVTLHDSRQLHFHYLAFQTPKKKLEAKGVHWKKVKVAPKDVSFLQNRFLCCLANLVSTVQSCISLPKNNRD